MDKATYIRAILECNFAGFKDEIIDTAVRRIMEYTPPTPIGANGIVVAEVVRCKDCKHFQEDECPWGAAVQNVNDFCSRGERKDEVEE